MPNEREPQRLENPADDGQVSGGLAVSDHTDRGSNVESRLLADADNSVPADVKPPTNGAPTRGHRGHYKPKQNIPPVVADAREVAARRHGETLGTPESHLGWTLADTARSEQLSPFDALNAIRGIADRIVAPSVRANASEIDPFAEIAPDQMVQVPWNVVWTLGFLGAELMGGLMRRTWDREDGLNKAFGIKGTGSGNPGAVARRLNIAQRRKLAMEVWHILQQEPGRSLTQAYKAVAAKHRTIGANVVEVAWKAEKEWVERRQVE